MRPTFYLNLQVVSYEEDKGTTLLSERIICKDIDKYNVYGLYEAINTKDYKPDDSLLVKDDVKPKDGKG